MLKEYKLNIEIYDDTIIIIIGKRKEFENWIKKNYGMKDITTKGYEGLHTRLYNGKENCYRTIVWLEKKCIDILSHELLHAAITIISDKSIKIDVDNDEPLVYLYGYMFKKFRKKIWGK